MDEGSVEVLPGLLPIVQREEEEVDPLGPEILLSSITIFTTIHILYSVQYVPNRFYRPTSFKFIKQKQEWIIKSTDSRFSRLNNK